MDVELIYEGGPFCVVCHDGELVCNVRFASIVDACCVIQQMNPVSLSLSQIPSNFTNDLVPMFESLNRIQSLAIIDCLLSADDPFCWSVFKIISPTLKQLELYSDEIYIDADLPPSVNILSFDIPDPVDIEHFISLQCFEWRNLKEIHLPEEFVDSNEYPFGMDLIEPTLIFRIPDPVVKQVLDRRFWDSLESRIGSNVFLKKLKSDPEAFGRSVTVSEAAEEIERLLKDFTEQSWMDYKNRGMNFELTREWKYEGLAGLLSPHIAVHNAPDHIVELKKRVVQQVWINQSVILKSSYESQIQNSQSVIQKSCALDVVFYWMNSI